jgi:hypothetical protein
MSDLDRTYAGLKLVGCGMAVAITPENESVYAVYLNGRLIDHLAGHNPPIIKARQLLEATGELSEEQRRFLADGRNWSPTEHDIFDPEN